MAPPLASLRWMIPIVVVDVGGIIIVIGAIILRVSIIVTDFTCEVQTHGVYGSMDLLFAPFFHLLDEEVQLGGDHICLLDGMHAFCTGLESFFAPPLIGDHLLDQCLGFGDCEVEETSSSSKINTGS